MRRARMAGAWSVRYALRGRMILIEFDRVRDRFRLAIDRVSVPIAFYSRAAADEYARELVTRARLAI